MRLGTQDALKGALQGLGFSGRLNTAFMERVNLTVRHGLAALARRTWATAQQSPHLLAHLEWWRAYYHGCRRPHESLRVTLEQPRERGGKRLAQHYRQRTEAQAAGRTNRRWAAREVLSCPLTRLPLEATTAKCSCRVMVWSGWCKAQQKKSDGASFQEKMAS